MNSKEFYENHTNFSGRTFSEYFISPGIRCKYDIILKKFGNLQDFKRAVDIGCSGNSILKLFKNFKYKLFFDIANITLTQYSNQNNNSEFCQPICGDMTKLPYRDNCFDIIFTLDTLEHINADEIAVSELSRVLRRKGIIIITIPHRMKYYSKQDKIIGHFRRYEMDRIISLFKKYGLKCFNHFGVYGQLMKISFFQKLNPEKIEINLNKLRSHYNSKTLFRKFWNIIVYIGSKIMILDAKYQPIKKRMNIGLIFFKI